MVTIPKKLSCLFPILFLLSSVPTTGLASVPTVFGPDDFNIKRWHFHFSLKRFRVDDPGKGVIIISKNTPEKKIRSGFVRINKRVIPLREFFRRNDLVLEKEIKIRSRNQLCVFLRGTRGASIRIEVRKEGLPPANNAPVADDQYVSTDEDETVFLTLTGSDPDGDDLTYSMVSGPNNGTLSGTAPGLTYSPDPDHNGPDSCTFKVSDGKVDSNVATVAITVNPVNDPPVANALMVSTDEDVAVGITLTASDVDGDPLTYAVVAGPSNGTLNGTAPTITYTPSFNFNGMESFTYQASDGTVDSNIATVSITVNPINDSPLAVDDSYKVEEDNVLDVLPPGVIDNDSDVESSGLTASLETAASHGMVTMNPDGSFIYTPDLDFNGQDTFTYTVTDGEGGTDIATVDITVLAVADIPEDVDYGLAEDQQQGGGALVGETICILNGNNVEARLDLAFPSPNSLGLAFEAFYNSRSDIIGVLGYGWTHTYSVSLDSVIVIDNTTYIRIVDEKGQAHYFLEDGSGSFKGAFKDRSHVRAEGGDYVWYRLNGIQYGFLGSGRLSWIDDEKGNRLRINYDAQGLLESVTDLASQRSLTFHYNAGGLLEWIEGPGVAAVPVGRWVTLSYDGTQNLVSVTYADDSGFDYTYDGHNLTEKKNKAGHLINTWTYDSQDRVIGNFSVQGKGVSVAYVSQNQVEVTDAYGVNRIYTLQDIDGRKRIVGMQGIANAPYSDNSVVRWVYDTEMRLIETESIGGAITQYQDYDDRGNPGTVILALGTPEMRVITYAYHPQINLPLSRTEAGVLRTGGNKVTIWDFDDDLDTTPNENPTRLLYRIVEHGFTRDASGDVVPFEYVTTFDYNINGQLVTTDGPLSGNGDTTHFSYDASTGDLLSIIRPLIGSTIFSNYDNAGRVGKITDVNGQSQEFTYDAKGRITSIIHSADGSSTTITYNLAGLPASVTDEDGITRTFDYDGTYGRLTMVTDALGNYIAYAYDNQGNRIGMSKHDSSNNRTSWKTWNYQHPDIPGKLWQEITADRPPTVYKYDNEGNVESIRDPNGNTTYYIYDALNRLIELEQSGQVISEYTYDVHGNLNSITDAEDHTTMYNYDDMGRVVSTSSPDTGTVAYVYDEGGNLIQKTDAKGIIVKYAYDTLNRLTAMSFPNPAENISYKYDIGPYAMGRRTGMTDPSGSTTFEYDARGRLAGKISTINNHDFVVGTTISPGNRVSSVTYPSGRSIDITRDSLGRMQGASTTFNEVTLTLLSNMTYRPFGGPSGMNTGSGGIVSNQSGECDCVEIANPGTDKERTYTYDYNGNLTSIRGTNTPWYDQDFLYDEQNRLISTTGRYGTINYSYDKVGNRSARYMNGQAETYSYLPGTNKLDVVSGSDTIAYSYDANGNTTTIGTRALLYNQNNRLIEVQEGAATIASYTYNGLGQRVIKQAGGVTTFYHYELNGNLIAESDDQGNMTAEYLYVGKIRVAMVDVASGSTYYYLNNKLGVPELMTDDTGTVVWEAIYKPFGEAEIHPKSSIVNNFRFPGHYYDEETGWHYNYHRYYDPNAGRYLTPDPIGLLGAINLFTYVGNNPINLFDLMGLAEGDWWDPRTYISVSHSTTIMGEGVTITRGGNEQKTISPLTLWGGSIDIYIGIPPDPCDTVYEYGLGLGKHIGAGHVYARPDSEGNYQVQGLVLHIGIGLGSPFFFTETLPDPNRPFRNLMNKKLYITNHAED